MSFWLRGGWRELIFQPAAPGSMSSSIALSIASPGNPLNLVEQHTHSAVPLSHTVFSTWNLLTGVAAMVLVPIIFILMRPAEGDIIAAGKDALEAAEKTSDLGDSSRADTFAGRLEGSRLCALVFVVAGAAYLAIDGQSPFAAGARIAQALAVERLALLRRQEQPAECFRLGGGRAGEQGQCGEE